MISREAYMQWLREFRDKPIIKVVTGLRRSGKSTILQMFMDELRTEGIETGQIFMVNFEEYPQSYQSQRLKPQERIHQGD